jgi:gold/copper resistance efflux system membrane fusion protein
VLAEGNKVEYRILKLGPVIAGMRSVLSGLAPGEKIIVKGLVRPGMVVTPRDVAMGGNMDAAAFRDAAELAAAE